MIGEPWGKAPCGSCGRLKLKRRREVSKEDEGIDPTTGSVAGCLLKCNRDAIATVNLTKFNKREG